MRYPCGRYGATEPGRLTPDEERWAEALAIERAKGAETDLFIAERIAALSAAGDEAGVTRFREIANRLNQLRSGTAQ